MNCPGCGNATVEKGFEGVLGASILLDVCHGCHGLWFDKTENLRLTPKGVLRLFREVHDPEHRRRNPLAQAMKCPRCRAALARTYDLARNNRYHYFRCPQGHGHFIPFFQFLREKGIVRTLSPKEVNQLKQGTHTVQCSNCAAPVALGTTSTCVHCETPVSVLDAGSVEALLSKQVQDSRRAILASASLGAIHQPESRLAHGGELGSDLVELGLEVLFDNLGDLFSGF
jgi:Zn-finger nucleic acid-binding protein